MNRLQICSIAPVEFRFRRSYNSSMIIPACLGGQKFTSLWIQDETDYRVDFIEYDFTKALKTPIPIPVMEIRADLFAAEQLDQKGCFVPAKETPTEKELAAAHAARRKYLENCVRMGDVEYGRSGKVDEIPGEWKNAVEELGVIREWCFSAPPPQFDCPVCAEKLKVGVAVCRACGAILDREKAEKFGLVDKQPAGEIKARVI